MERNSEISTIGLKLHSADLGDIKQFEDTLFLNDQLYDFSYILNSDCFNSSIYSRLLPSLDPKYGSTIIFASQFDNNQSLFGTPSTQSQQGVISRYLQYLLDDSSEKKVKCSFMQANNKKIYDLLNNSMKIQSKKDQFYQIYVDQQTKIEIFSLKDAENLISQVKKSLQMIQRTKRIQTVFIIEIYSESAKVTHYFFDLSLGSLQALLEQQPVTDSSFLSGLRSFFSLEAHLFFSPKSASELLKVLAIYEHTLKGLKPQVSVLWPISQTAGRYKNCHFLDEQSVLSTHTFFSNSPCKFQNLTLDLPCSAIKTLNQGSIVNFLDDKRIDQLNHTISQMAQDKVLLSQQVEELKIYAGLDLVSQLTEDKNTLQSELEQNFETIKELRSARDKFVEELSQVRFEKQKLNKDLQNAGKLIQEQKNTIKTLEQGIKVDRKSLNLEISQIRTQEPSLRVQWESEREQIRKSKHIQGLKAQLQRCVESNDSYTQILIKQKEELAMENEILREKNKQFQVQYKKTSEQCQAYQQVNWKLTREINTIYQQLQDLSQIKTEQLKFSQAEQQINKLKRENHTQFQLLKSANESSVLLKQRITQVMQMYQQQVQQVKQLKSQLAKPRQFPSEQQIFNISVWDQSSKQNSNRSILKSFNPVQKLNLTQKLNRFTTPPLQQQNINLRTQNFKLKQQKENLFHQYEKTQKSLQKIRNFLFKLPLVSPVPIRAQTTKAIIQAISNLHTSFSTSKLSKRF